MCLKKHSYKENNESAKANKEAQKHKREQQLCNVSVPQLPGARHDQQPRKEPRIYIYVQRALSIAIVTYRARCGRRAHTQ